MPYTSFAVAGAGPTIGGRIVQARHICTRKVGLMFMTGADKPRRFGRNAFPPWE